MSQVASQYGGKHYWDADIYCSKSAQQVHDTSAMVKPYSGNPLDLTLLVTCYNEEQFIVDTLAEVVKTMQQVGISYEIIVADDCSTDKSVELVDSFIAAHPDINIMLRVNKQNKGLAQNYIDGAFLGRGKYYRLICGDNAEPSAALVKIFNTIGEADIIIPYHTTVPGKSKFRIFVSKIFTWLINIISGNKIKYYNGLQVHLRHNVMRWHPNTRGFAFQASLLCLLLEKGFTYKEVPCVPIERRGGGGNAFTWKNLRSVSHTIVSILLRRLAG